jgi:hypothetical protein
VSLTDQLFSVIIREGLEADRVFVRAVDEGHARTIADVIFPFAIVEDVDPSDAEWEPSDLTIEDLKGRFSCIVKGYRHNAAPCYHHGRARAGGCPIHGEVAA